MSIPKFVGVALLGASLGIASAYASPVTNNFVFTGEGNSVVASGSFTFDSALTGTIGYSNLDAFSITLAGQSYDLAFVNTLTAGSDYVYFGYNISANTFVPALVPGYVPDQDPGSFTFLELNSILAATRSDLTAGFFFSPLVVQGGNNADGAFTEYRTLTDGTAIAFEISSAVPEPSTWIMMIFGFLGLAGLVHRRRNKIALRAI